MTTSPWPVTAQRDTEGAMMIGGVAVGELVERYGTPLWVVDEHDLRTRCRVYRDGFAGSRVAYASKAWCTTGILQIVAEEGLWIDVASGGELHAARAAGCEMSKIYFHGNNKSVDELRLAAQWEVGRVVVDSFDELTRLQMVGEELDHTFEVLLRITPGIDAHTHEYVRTGHDDSKFGFATSLGLADQALVKAMSLTRVSVVGVHAHIGSQIFGAEPFVANAEALVELLARWRKEHDVVMAELNLGGGMGIRYTHEDHPVEVSTYGEAVLAAVAALCARWDYPPPSIAVEPGRAIVGPSTVTLYTVGTIKPLPGLRTYVAVDGGWIDNIRPALYGATHEARLAGRTSDEGVEAYTVVGKHCESGDVLAERASLPADLRIGDVLAFAGTGAFTESMSMNYNRLPRPGAVVVRDGTVRELIRRETYADLLARDVPLH